MKDYVYRIVLNCNQSRINIWSNLIASVAMYISDYTYRKAKFFPVIFVRLCFAVIYYLQFQRAVKGSLLQKFVAIKFLEF